MRNMVARVSRYSRARERWYATACMHTRVHTHTERERERIDRERERERERERD